MTDRLRTKTSGVRCLLVCTGEVGHSAYRQRALMIAGQLEELDYRVAVLWFSRLSNLFQSKLLLQKHWLTVPVLPFYAAPGLVCSATRFMSRLLARLVVKAWRIQLVVAENQTSAAICAGIGVPLICDFHGDGFAERQVYEAPERETRLALADEGITCRRTAGWICASAALVHVLRSRHDISVPAVVVPCCVDISRYATFERRRKRARTQLGLSNRWVVCYLGGLGKWQEIPETLSLVAAMKTIEQRLFFLLITPDNTDRYASQLAALGEEGKDYTRLCLTHEEVLETLPAADLGLLLRAPSPVNYVSSPTKCGEYLASGVPVLTTPYAGDASGVVSETGSGLILSGDPNSRENVELALSFLRASMAARESVAQRCHRAAAEHYNVIRSAGSIGQLLTEVLAISLNENRQQSEATISR